jgi:hypothetical protein
LAKIVFSLSQGEQLINAINSPDEVDLSSKKADVNSPWLTPTTPQRYLICSEAVLYLLAY